MISKRKLKETKEKKILRDGNIAFCEVQDAIKNK